MASTDLPAASAAFERYRLLRYGLVVAISAALHLLVWQFRDVLERRPEPQPKPEQTIEVVLLPPPPPPAAKAPEPAPEPPRPKKAEPKPPAPKPVAVPKPVPRPKPAAPPPEPKPQPKPEPRPKPKPLPARRVEPEPDPVQETRTEPRPEPPRRPVERPAPPAEPVEKPAPVQAEAPPSREVAAPPTTRRADTADADASAAKRQSGESGKTGGGQGQADEGPTTKAAYLRNPKPDYPALARHRQLEGRVVLRIRVLADGRIGHAEVHASSGHAILDESALAFVRENWRFKPAMKAGHPVESWVNVPIVFNLD